MGVDPPLPHIFLLSSLFLVKSICFPIYERITGQKSITIPSRNICCVCSLIVKGLHINSYMVTLNPNKHAGVHFSIRTYSPIFRLSDLKCPI